MTCSRPYLIASSKLRNSMRWWLATASLMVGVAADAADFDIGLSAGLDHGRVDCVASAPCDRSSSHFKATAAYRLSEPFDVQLTLFDAGRFKGGDTTPLGTEFGGTFKVSGVALSAGYRWEIAPLWSLRAHAGLASVRTRFNYINPVWGSASQSTAQPLVGLGLAYAVTPTLRLGLEGDVTRFKVHTQHGPLRMLGLAAQFSF
jgi:hypothetical protein